MYFLETLQVCAPCHGGVLYSFWYWWHVVWIFYEFFKYWKKKYLHFLCSIFQVFFAFHAISNIKKKLVSKKSGGGGVDLKFLFVEKQFFLISRFMLFSTLKNIEKCPFTYWLNGRWFLQILVERDSWNLYPLYPLFPCSDFVSQMWGWFYITKIVVLVSEPVRGRSRATELPCCNNITTELSWTELSWTPNASAHSLYNQTPPPPLPLPPPEGVWPAIHVHHGTPRFQETWCYQNPEVAWCHVDNTQLYHCLWC